MFPMLISSSGLVVCMLALVMTEFFFVVSEVKDVEKMMKSLILLGACLQSFAVYVLAHWSLPQRFAISNEFDAVRPLDCIVCIWLGLWGGVVIGIAAEYYTSRHNKPVKDIAEAYVLGAPPGVILGLAVGYLSCVVPICCLAMIVLVAHSLIGPYGIALAALGMLSIMTICLAIDAYDSIADNAGGIAEMSGLPSTTHKDITDVLGGAGAIGNGYAIGSALLVSLSLLCAFRQQAGIAEVDVMDKFYFAGLLLGAMQPYAFSSITMKSVAKAASVLIDYCRSHFYKKSVENEDPDYTQCIKIATAAALADMLPAGLIVIGAPIVVGLVFGKKCTFGLLQGALISGVQLAISMINTGGAWDNAKKSIASKNAKTTTQHENAVVGDIVGDPLKDVSGPSLNVLVILGAITSLVFGDFISRCSASDGGPGI